MSRLAVPEGTSILKNQTIKSIKEDPRGFIWIAASNGLYRYDGTELVEVFAGRFRAIELNKKTHTLAFVHLKGVYLYDYENETSTHITERDIGQLDIDIQCTFFDTDSSLLIGHREGFTRYIPSSRSFTFHPIQSELAQTIVISEIVRDIENPDLLWIGTNSGLIRYQLASHKQKQYLFESQQPPLVSSINTITTVVPVDHRIYLGTWHSGVVIFDKKTETYLQRFVEDRTPDTSRIPVDHIFAIVPDVQGRLWFSSTLGTMLYDGSEDRVIWHQKT
jgi:ligand-binding sensor domain-containing protein